MKFMAIAFLVILAACGRDPIKASDFSFDRETSYFVMTKDTPESYLGFITLCRLSPDGSYPIEILDGGRLYICEVPYRSETSGNRFNIHTDSAALSKDEAVILADGRTVHVAPYFPNTSLGYRIQDVGGGRFVSALRERNTVMRPLLGEVLAYDLEMRSIRYVGHVTQDGNLEWRDPGDLADALKELRGFDPAKFDAAAPVPYTTRCIPDAQTPDLLNCQAQPL